MSSMSPGEHYRKAEDLLAEAIEHARGGRVERAQALAAVAAGHGALAAIPVPAGGRW